MTFNSLGSNYKFDFVLKAMFSLGSAGESMRLKNYLGTRYGGVAVLFYKGREAIKFALELTKLPKGSKVGITGFTCYVVYQAVVEAGFEAVFLDIQKDNLNFSATELSKHRNLKAVIIQNTLGFPCDAGQISNYCKENKILLIEDLAHSVGIKYKNGLEAGTVGDFTALSFSQDKMVDAVSGGALIIRNVKYLSGLKGANFKKLPFINTLKDRFYPKFTYLIRFTYPVGIGKAIHLIVKKLKLLSQGLPDSKGITFHLLPNWYCGLIGYQYKNLEKDLVHRKKIADIYKANIKNSLNGLVRFPILVKSRKELINYLKRNGIFVSDTWYDAPVAPKRYSVRAYHNGECKNSEFVSKQIINLPTHVNISEGEAQRISSLIKQWQITNQE